jgi:hypothetical protein
MAERRLRIMSLPQWRDAPSNIPDCLQVLGFGLLELHIPTFDAIVLPSGAIPSRYVREQSRIARNSNVSELDFGICTFNNPVFTRYECYSSFHSVAFYSTLLSSFDSLSLSLFRIILFQLTTPGVGLGIYSHRTSRWLPLFFSKVWQPRLSCQTLQHWDVFSH